MNRNVRQPNYSLTVLQPSETMTQSCHLVIRQFQALMTPKIGSDLPDGFFSQTGLISSIAMTNTTMTDTITAPAEPTVDLDFVVLNDEALEQPFRVIIHNDDITPIDFVVAVLCNIFELGAKKAIAIAYEAHYTGLSLVCVLPYQEAYRRVYQAQTAARELGYPLSFTLEPEEE